MDHAPLLKSFYVLRSPTRRYSAGGDRWVDDIDAAAKYSTLAQAREQCRKLARRAAATVVYVETRIAAEHPR